MNNSGLSAKAIFDHALEIPSPTQRQAYLDEACANAPELRQRVEALLRSYEELGSFLAEPAVAPPATGAYTPAEAEPAGGAEPAAGADPRTRLISSPEPPRPPSAAEPGSGSEHLPQTT